MFQIFPENTKIPFMSMRVPCAILSVLLVGASIFFILTKGFNYGVDFAGGIQMVLQFPESSQINAESLRAELAKTQISGVSVQRFGQDEATNEYIIHFAGDFADEENIRSRLNNIFPAGAVSEFRLSGLEKAYISFNQATKLDELKAQLNAMDWGLLEISSVAQFGRPEAQEYEISFANFSEAIVADLETTFAPGESEIKLQKLEFVGAKVGSDLKTAALLSLIIATFLIFIYIFLRFDLTYAPGVVFAVIHDIIITAGIFSLLGYEIDLTIIAALLTLAGYSINDTIVVYDRIREMRQTLKGKNFAEVIDLAVNQTMNRTVITSGTTLLTTVILWSLGGPVIHGFAFALSIGIIVGTYSSIFVGAALVLWTDQYQQKLARDQRKRVAA